MTFVAISDEKRRRADELVDAIPSCLGRHGMRLGREGYQPIQVISAGEQVGDLDCAGLDRRVAREGFVLLAHDVLEIAAERGAEAIVSRRSPGRAGAPSSPRGGGDNGTHQG
jgi:hypothetical protein